MAKSLRAKTKQANRRKKRNDEGSYYAAVEAARVQKVSDRLLGKDGAKKEGEGGEVEMEGEEEEAAAEEGMSIPLTMVNLRPGSVRRRVVCELARCWWRRTLDAAIR